MEKQHKKKLDSVYIMSRNNKIHIGTSGWHYEHWKGVFYPENITAEQRLSYYAEHFNDVEINNTFYNLPDKKTVKNWQKTVAPDFTFAVKASRYITHMKKLKDPAKSIKKFFDTVAGLEDKIGPILFQLPPRWRVNTERLESFLKALPKKYRCTFEFRDKSWFTDKIYRILSEYNAAFCIYNLTGRSSHEHVTADFVYIRLHGPTREAYEGKHTKKQLNSWARKIDKWNSDGKDVYLYFDNDQQGFAVENALTLVQALKI
jgi:uncharacterized protein YecE (DUF72 family)